MSPIRFVDVHWGPDEAKGDERLVDYFVEIPEFENLIDGRSRYVIGRKGTGKTAICERIRLMAEDNPLWFTSSLSLRNFPLPVVKALRDRSLTDKSQFVPVWKFLLLVELARLITTDNGAGPGDAVRDLRDFLDKNFPARSLGFIDTLKSLEKSHAKVNLITKWIGAEAGKERGTEATVSVDYQVATRVLRDLVRQVFSESKYFIFMDELDEGYQAGDEGLRLLLLALLRATEDVFLELDRSGVQFRPILVLRSDIFDRLEDNDLNKLDDYTIRLNWHASATGDYSLRKVTDARIRASITGSPLRKPWEEIAVDADPELPKGVPGLWRYMTNRTLERPRDIIKFLKLCAKERPADQLTFADVNEAEHRFSDWLYNEMRDEIHSHLPIWREALNCLTRVGRGVLSPAELKRELNDDRAIRRWQTKTHHSHEDVIRALFDFGIVGNLDESRRWLFKYKDDDLALNPRMKLIVHYGFHKKLRILPGGKAQRGGRSRR